ncbi:MAG TPA: MFS transporter [Candidatus Dormibacteraeota bacterium]|jgi:FHS family glucose/mannose:H+ symporter-like MFS transporter|nr:MFS transporter [Candidatus Dormibacteraeota bacterium]
MSEPNAPARSVTGAGFAVFLLLGIVIASYGPSIPHITERFTVSASVAGLIVSANFLGEVIGLMALGLTHARWRLGGRLAVGTSLFAGGLLLAAVAPTWPLLLLAVFVLGIGAGGLVVLVNLYFATRFGRRSPAMLGLVNTAYGVGTFIGPALVALTRGYSIVFAGTGAGALVCLVLLRRAVNEAPRAELAPVLNARTVGIVITFALLLLVYEGLEAGVGTWEATDLLSLGLSAQFAAGATSVFWGAFTLGRVLTAPLAVRWEPQRILVPAFIISAVLLLGIRAHLYAPLMFALVGFCAAPIFPVVVSWMTRVIPNATTLVTYALLGAVIGSALVPAALGGLIAIEGAEQLPLGVAACALASLGMVGVISLRLRS